MAFEKLMDKAAYRRMSNEELELRRADVADELENPESEFTAEEMRGEVAMLKDEEERRSAAAALKIQERAMVAASATPEDVIDSTETEEAKAVRTAPTSLGEHFAQYVEQRGHEKSFHLVAPAYRAATDTQVTPQSVVPAITTYDKTIVEGKRIPFNVLDLLGREVIDGNTLVFFREGALQGAPAVTAEGNKKPQVHFADPTPVTVTLQKIAAFVKESDEVIDDAAFLASTINGRLLYELNFVRQATVISDLLATSGIQTATWPSTATFTDISLDIADAVADAIADVQEESGYAANGVVITPAMWKQLRTGHFNSGEYVGGGYFEQGARPMLWGLPVAVSSQLTAGHILVGAFDTCASLVTKAEGVTVESTNTDQDDFVKNLMTIRAEVREKLAVRRPAGFVDLTVAS